jgi:hypothetical protein
MFDSNGWWVNFSAADGARSKSDFIYPITNMSFSEDPGFHTTEEAADEFAREEFTTQRDDAIKDLESLSSPDTKIGNCVYSLSSEVHLRLQQVAKDKLAKAEAALALLNCPRNVNQ